MSSRYSGWPGAGGLQMSSSGPMQARRILRGGIVFARQNHGRAVASIQTSIRRRHRAARPWQPLLFPPAAVLTPAVALPEPALAALPPPGVTFTHLPLLTAL